MPYIKPPPAPLAHSVLARILTRIATEIVVWAFIALMTLLCIFALTWPLFVFAALLKFLLFA